MRVSILAACSFALITTVYEVKAAPPEFPYEAVVKSDGVVVRSGPGERYDPTLKLTTGDRVTVHRHDPGGWYMVSPPTGSFSWIDAAYVERTGSERGVVTVPQTGNGIPPRVVVWIGSQFTDEHKYFGRQLATGDEVLIIGEKQGQTDRGPTTFYKIAPPRLEYRWVKGDYIVPLADAGHIAGTVPVATPAATDNSRHLDPFARSGSDRAMRAPGFLTETSPSLLERELTRGVGAAAVSSPGSTGTDAIAGHSQLYTLDDQLRGMLAQTPDHWDLATMEQAYQQLQARSDAGVASQIEARLAAINARKRIKAEYDAFLSITRQTEQRDATLLSMQQSFATGVPAGTMPVELGDAAPFPPQMSGISAPIPPGSPPGVTPAPDAANSRGTPQLDGAGIIRRVPQPQPGWPQYALVTPDGRHLAYIAGGQGVRLDEYLNRPMGIVGQRSFDGRLGSDVIVVEQLTPVQLQPQ